MTTTECIWLACIALVFIGGVAVGYLLNYIERLKDEYIERRKREIDEYIDRVYTGPKSLDD